MNKIILKGRLIADPALKRTKNDTLFTDFSIAVTRPHNSEQTDFINCTAWRSTAEFIAKYFSKGKEILLVGELHIDKYQKDDETRYSATVSVDNAEFCGNKKENQINAIAGDDTTSLDVNDTLFQVSDVGEDELPF